MTVSPRRSEGFERCKGTSPMQNDSKDTQSLDLDDRRREIPLFPYGVIADLVHLEPHHRGLYVLLTKKAQQDFTIPGSLRRQVAECCRACLLMPKGWISRRLVDGDCPSESG